MLKARSPFRALAKHPAISPPPPSRAGTSFPPCCGNPVISFYARYAAALFVDQLNSVPSTHMRCRTTASLRATATVAFRSPLRLASLIPQAFSALARGSAAFIRLKALYPLSGRANMRRAVVYRRVSTLDNQERDLREVADRMGCEIVMGLQGSRHQRYQGPR